MKHIKYILTFLLFIFYLNPVYSQAKIATLDVFKLLKDSKAAISITDQLNAVAKKYDAEGQKKQTTIQKQEEELLRQKSTLTPEAFSIPTFPAKTITSATDMLNSAAIAS